MGEVKPWRTGEAPSVDQYAALLARLVLVCMPAGQSRQGKAARPYVLLAMP